MWDFGIRDGLLLLLFRYMMVYYPPKDQFKDWLMCGNESGESSTFKQSTTLSITSLFLNLLRVHKNKVNDGYCDWRDGEQHRRRVGFCQMPRTTRGDRTEKWEWWFLEIINSINLFWKDMTWQNSIGWPYKMYLHCKSIPIKLYVVYRKHDKNSVIGKTKAGIKTGHTWNCTLSRKDIHSRSQVTCGLMASILLIKDLILKGK